MNKFVLADLIGKHIANNVRKVSNSLLVTPARSMGTESLGNKVFGFDIRKIDGHAGHDHNMTSQPRDLSTMFRGIPTVDFFNLYLNPVIKHLEYISNLMRLTQLTETFMIEKISNTEVHCEFTIGDAYVESGFDASYIYRLYESLEKSERYIVLASLLNHTQSIENVKEVSIFHNNYKVQLDYEAVKNDISMVRSVLTSLRDKLGLAVLSSVIIINDDETDISISLSLNTEVVVDEIRTMFKYDLIDKVLSPWDYVEPTPPDDLTSDSDSSSEEPSGSDSDSGRTSDSTSEQPVNSDSDSTSTSETLITSDSDSTTEPEVPVTSESDSTSDAPVNSSESDSTSTSESDPGTSTYGVGSESDSTSEIV